MAQQVLTCMTAVENYPKFLFDCSNEKQEQAKIKSVIASMKLTYNSKEECPLVHAVFAIAVDYAANITLEQLRQERITLQDFSV